jgi:hypothetical protein
MEDEADAHTLDLLKDMRKLCDEMNASFEHFHARFWELKQSISNPNTHGLSKELTFKVMQLETTPIRTRRACVRFRLTATVRSDVRRSSRP